MNAERIYVIPDIHGRADLLEELLETLFYKEEQLDLSSGKDKLIFLGDMIDRGPESSSVLYTVMDLVKKYPSTCIALAGNHEWLCINAYNSGEIHDLKLWYINGGKDTLASFQNKPVPKHVVEWMERLPLQHYEPGFFFSHAPVPNEEDRRSENKGKPFTIQELTWTYHNPEDFYARRFGDRVGVYGHVHALGRGVMAPRFYDHAIFADAGCGCSDDAPLVAIEVKTRRVIWIYPQQLDLPPNEA